MCILSLFVISPFFHRKMQTRYKAEVVNMKKEHEHEYKVLKLKHNHEAVSGKLQYTRRASLNRTKVIFGR